MPCLPSVSWMWWWWWCHLNDFSKLPGRSFNSFLQQKEQKSLGLSQAGEREKETFPQTLSIVYWGQVWTNHRVILFIINMSVMLYNIWYWWNNYVILYAWDKGEPSQGWIIMHEGFPGENILDVELLHFLPFKCSTKIYFMTGWTQTSDTAFNQI